MAGGAWISEGERQRIAALAALGVGTRAIAERFNRDASTVRKIKRKRGSMAQETRLARVRLARESVPTLLQHTREASMRPETVREIFIDALTPAHFAKPRAGAERFLGDLAADLARDGFTAPVLARAAEILRGERVGTFPKIPVCKRACVRAEIELGSAGPGPGPDRPAAAPGESQDAHDGATVAGGCESQDAATAPDGSREPTGAASQRAKVAA